MQTLVKETKWSIQELAQEESVIVDCNEIVNEVLTDLNHTLKQLNAKVTVEPFKEMMGTIRIGGQ
jgi:hypothetical protein